MINAGAGNDAISVHYGRGIVDCGPGRDIYHVAKSRKRGYKFRNCEKVDYRSERQRGGHGLKPLHFEGDAEAAQRRERTSTVSPGAMSSAGTIEPQITMSPRSSSAPPALASSRRA